MRRAARTELASPGPYSGTPSPCREVKTGSPAPPPGCPSSVPACKIVVETGESERSPGPPPPTPPKKNCLKVFYISTFRVGSISTCGCGTGKVPFTHSSANVQPDFTLPPEMCVQQAYLVSVAYLDLVVSLSFIIRSDSSRASMRISDED